MTSMFKWIRLWQREVRCLQSTENSALTQESQCWGRIVLQFAKKSVSESEYVSPGHGPSEYLRCFTTESDVTIMLVVSALRPLKRPRREDRICLLLGGAGQFYGARDKKVISIDISHH